jgi:hypothetical protein
MRDEEKDAAAEETAPPCEVCGRPSGCAIWGKRLCYGEMNGSRLGCATRLYSEMPTENEKDFALAWVAKEKARMRKGAA